MGGHRGSVRPPYMSPSELCFSNDSKSKGFNVRGHYVSPASVGGRDTACCEVWDVRVAAGGIRPAVRGGIMSY